MRIFSLIVAILLNVAWVVAAAPHDDLWDTLIASPKDRLAAATAGLQSLGRALLQYELENRALPSHAIRNEEGKPLLSWRVAILPQLGYGQLYRRFHLDEPWDSESNRKLLREMPSEFSSRRLDVGAGKTAFLVPVGEKTAFPPDRGLGLGELCDGLSRTLLVLEATSDRAVPWTAPANLVYEAAQPRIGLPDQGEAGFLGCRANGEVTWMPASTSNEEINELITVGIDLKPGSGSRAKRDPNVDLRRALCEAYQSALENCEKGLVTHADVYAWSCRLLDADRALARNEQQITYAVMSQMDRIGTLQTIVGDLWQREMLPAGRAALDDISIYRQEADRLLFEEMGYSVPTGKR